MSPRLQSSDPTAVYRRQGFGNQVGFGDRPSVLVVDFVNGFADPDMFGGGNIGNAISKTTELVDAARRHGVPVIFTRVVYRDDGTDAGQFCVKVPALKQLTEAAPASQIVDAFTVQDDDHVVRKTEPSAFFGTGLADWLRERSIDTVIIAGCTTSGCVRASVVDSMSHNFRTIVVEDCVGDRAKAPHEANLFDMAQKYADVVGSGDVLSYFRSLKDGARKP